MTTFFSLTEIIKSIVRIEQAEQNSEAVYTTIGSSLSSSVLKYSIPTIAVTSVSIPIYEYITKLHKPKNIDSGIDKLSTSVDGLVSGSTVSIEIPNSQQSTPMSSRQSPTRLGASSILPSRGSYTREEADYLIKLKQDGVDTSASRTRMHPKIESLIRAKALEYGVDPDIAVKIAIVESGGNPNAVSSTGAIGIFQFTGDTANRMGLVNRFNLVDNIDAGIRLILADKKFVGKFNSDVATYLALQIGGPNAKYVLGLDKDTKISELPKNVQSVIRGNLGGNSGTVGEYIEANAIALEKKIVEQKSKPVYAPMSRDVPKSAPIPIANPGNTTTVRTTAPTSTPATYITPTVSNVPIEDNPSPPNTLGSLETKPIPSLSGVVRHKSGLYFNVA